MTVKPGKRSKDIISRRNNKNLPTGVSLTQSHRWQTIATVPEAEILQREVTHTEAQKELTSREIYTFATGKRREADNRRTLTTQVAVQSQALGIHHGDFRALAPTLIPDNSAQLVFTDPPYDEKSVDLFEAAAKEAARVLVPVGSFIAYSGQKYLAPAIRVCSKHLTYWWLFALVHDGPANSRKSACAASGSPLSGSSRTHAATSRRSSLTLCKAPGAKKTSTNGNKARRKRRRSSND